MSMNLFLLFFFLGTIYSYPQFKVIKHGGDDTWTIFKRFGNEQCSYYESVDNFKNDDYFLTLEQEELYFAFYKEPGDQKSWRSSSSDCPQIDTNLYRVLYVKSMATGAWTFTDDSPANVVDYDLDTCIEYENLEFTLWDNCINYDYEFTENPNNTNCVDLVLEEIGSDVGDEFLFIQDYADGWCQYGNINSVCVGKTLIF